MADETSEKLPSREAIEFLVGFLKSDNADGEGLKIRAAELILSHTIEIEKLKLSIQALLNK